MRVIEHPVPGQEPLQLGYEIYWPGLQEFAGQGDIEFDALTRVRAMQVTNMMGYVKTGFTKHLSLADSVCNGSRMRCMCQTSTARLI